MNIYILDSYIKFLLGEVHQFVISNKGAINVQGHTRNIFLYLIDTFID